jgi:hypothetical protein
MLQCDGELLDHAGLDHAGFDHGQGACNRPQECEMQVAS